MTSSFSIVVETDHIAECVASRHHGMNFSCQKS